MIGLFLSILISITLISLRFIFIRNANRNRFDKEKTWDEKKRDYELAGGSIFIWFKKLFKI